MNRFIELGLAVLLDRLVGEFRFAHPLIGYGRMVKAIEGLTYGNVATSKAIDLRLRGLIAALLLTVPMVIIIACLQQVAYFDFPIQVLSMYLALGMQSLQEHAHAVTKSLESGDLDAAKACVAKIVSRDTTNMAVQDVSCAAIESVLENGSDAIFAPMFWFVIGGAPLVVLYRLVNTLDAMWGYKNDRYLYFGWAAARFDDVMNYIPARLTALTYTLVGCSASAWSCWRQQARLWYSPNAGPVMAAGAGALQVQLGGAAVYHGSLKERPILGTGNAPNYHDISRAVQLVYRGLLLWLVLLLVSGGLFARAWW